MSLRFDVNNDVLGLEDLKLPFFIFWSLRNIISKNFGNFSEPKFTKIEIHIFKSYQIGSFWNLGIVKIDLT